MTTLSAIRKTIKLGETFWSKSASPMPLAFLRIGLATILILQVILMWNDIPLLYAGGLFRPELAQRSRNDLLPSSIWLSDPLAFLGLSHVSPTYALLGMYLSSLIALGIGLQTRVVAWFSVFLHSAWVMSGFETSYGADDFSQLGLFICAVSPCSSVLSVDALAKEGGPRQTNSSQTSAGAGRGIRLLTAWLGIAYGAAGIEKAQGMDWWNGESVHRALFHGSENLAPFLENFPSLAVAVGWGTVILDLAWPVFVWIPRYRCLILAMTILMHIGILFFLHLVTFSIVMILLNGTVLFHCCLEDLEGKHDSDLLTVQSQVILFDGDCHFCNKTMGRIAQLDSARRFRFVSMQSELGQHLLRETPKGENEPKSDYASLVLIENGVSIRRSTAALRIARHLSGAWPVLSLLYIVSMSLRDRVYDIVAHNRLRFGDHHKRTCPLPSQDMRNRMLESAKAFDLD